MGDEMTKTVAQVLADTQTTTSSGVDISGMETALQEQLKAAKKQASTKIDQSVSTGLAELEQSQQAAQESYAAQRRQIDIDEARSKDDQALYAELRGDRGGIGAAQYDSISNTAAENRLAVMQAQSKTAQETAQKMAQLRADGEFEKAEQLLALTQDYLGQLTELQQWAAEYDLSAAKFAESVNQWQQEYDQKQAELTAKQEQWAAEFESDTSDTQQKRLKEAGESLLSAGILPSESQLAAMGMTAAQAKSYLAALAAANVAKSTATTTSSGSSGRKTSASSAAADTAASGTTGSATDTTKSGGEYALYLAAKESGGDPRTYVKNHYKEYGLTALPTEKAYTTWKSSLCDALGQTAFETFLRKLNISLSEDSPSAIHSLTGKYWPSLTAAQRQKVESLYQNYGMSYQYGA